MLTRKKMRKILLAIPLTRELFFLFFQKKLYRKPIDKKIESLIKGRKKITGVRIDNLIVSLTSFPPRIMEVKYAIYSLLDQTILPEKIVLWLEASHFPNKEQDLPTEFSKLKEYGLIIMWCDDLRSYSKLIPSLEQFPNHYIVIADDDIYYHKKWLEKLWFEHLKYPDDIICHIAEQILFKGKVMLPYIYWKRYVKNKSAGYHMLGCACGGILYHINYLYKDVDRTDLFLNFAPHADDIWFYFMAVLNGTMIRVVEKPYTKVRYVNPYREYGLNNEHKLSTINVDNDFNDQQFANIKNYYGIDIYTLIERQNENKNNPQLFGLEIYTKGMEQLVSHVRNKCK